MLALDREDLERGIRPWDLDDDLLAACARDGRRRFRVSRPATPCVVLGRGSRADVEVRMEACREAGVPGLRRPGGGCAVVLDPGNLVLSRVERVPGIGDNGRHFRRISDELIALLARCGVTGVEMRGISDLCLGDRKVGGASIRRADGLLYYATTLLVEPDLALVERLLPHPPREPDYRRGRPHRDFMGHIEAPGGGGMEALAERLRRDVELGGEEDACCRPGG